jgi:hypothetical protein
VHQLGVARFVKGAIGAQIGAVGLPVVPCGTSLAEMETANKNKRWRSVCVVLGVART